MDALVIGIIAILAAALLLYILFGGADFGAGILELFLSSKNRDEERRVAGFSYADVVTPRVPPDPERCHC